MIQDIIKYVYPSKLDFPSIMSNKFINPFYFILSYKGKYKSICLPIHIQNQMIISEVPESKSRYSATPYIIMGTPDLIRYVYNTSSQIEMAWERKTEVFLSSTSVR